MRSIWGIIGIVTALFATDVGADHWPNWRGPTASGVSGEQGLPVRWSDSENIAWKAPLRGLGISSPIVWGELVIVTSQAGNGVVRPGPRLVQSGNPAEAGERPLGEGPTSGSGKVTFLVAAFERASGRPAWQFELPAEGPLPTVHEKHNLASPSPVTDGQRVYAWFGTGQIAAVDLDGKLVWKKHLGAEYGPFEINWGHGSSPSSTKTRSSCSATTNQSHICWHSIRGPARCGGKRMRRMALLRTARPLWSRQRESLRSS